MSVATVPSANLSILGRADGSAQFSQHGYTVIGTINGPIEVQRRDANPEKAVVEVTVRPATGVGGVHERHLEHIIGEALRAVILLSNFPRTMIQITLQVLSMPENDSETSSSNSKSSNLPIFPAMIQTASLALLDASIPIRTVATSTLLAIKGNGKQQKILSHPSVAEIHSADSIHVFVFTADGDAVSTLSDGDFSLDDWQTVYDTAKEICLGAARDDDAMEDDEHEKPAGLAQFVRRTMQGEAEKDTHWKR